MKETTVTMDKVNPVNFLGAGDIRLKRIRSEYPEVVVFTRGNTLKLSGKTKAVQQLEHKLTFLLSVLERNSKLSDEEFHEVIRNPQNTTEEQLNKKTTSEEPILLYSEDGKVFKCRTENQKKLVNLIQENDITFATGPAGTGKTYTAVAAAVQMLKLKKIKKIILTRPAVEAGEHLGFLPGDLQEKIAPYLQPFYDALKDMISREKLQSYFRKRAIEVAPLAYMRGRTLNHACIILDEAQNATSMQIKMFLTRLGPDAKAVITGDYSQVDLPSNQKSGLEYTLNLVGHIKGIASIHLSSKDVVRHKLVVDIIKAYEQTTT